MSSELEDSSLLDASVRILGKVEVLNDTVCRLTLLGSSLSMHSHQVPHTAVNGLYRNHKGILSLMPVGAEHISLYVVK